jgi:hypothetical protein
MAHSSAARAGIENFTKTLALEWSKYDIRLNCVAPGTILSSGMRTYPEAVQDVAARGARTVPAARLGTESEVSAGVVFLLSPAAAFITGQTLGIDGGSSMQKGRLLDVTSHAATSAWNGFHLEADWTGTPFEPLPKDWTRSGDVLSDISVTQFRAEAQLRTRTRFASSPLRLSLRRAHRNAIAERTSPLLASLPRAFE